MGKLQLELDGLSNFVNQAEIDKFMALAPRCNQSLHDKTGKGNDYLGWVNLPNEITKSELAEINETASQLKQLAEVVVVVGIGGSYFRSQGCY
jgi:glucose-6-phosphate isomerase